MPRALICARPRFICSHLAQLNWAARVVLGSGGGRVLSGSLYLADSRRMSNIIAWRGSSGGMLMEPSGVLRGLEGWIDVSAGNLEAGRQLQVSARY